MLGSESTVYPDDQARLIKGLERENGPLKRLVADLSLEKLVLKDITSGNLQAPHCAGRRLRVLGEILPLGSPRLLDGLPVAWNATLRGHNAGGRRCADTGYYGAGGPVWPATATGKSQSCSTKRAGISGQTVCGASGAVRG